MYFCNRIIICQYPTPFKASTLTVAHLVWPEVASWSKQLVFPIQIHFTERFYSLCTRAWRINKILCHNYLVNSIQIMWLFSCNRFNVSCSLQLPHFSVFLWFWELAINETQPQNGFKFRSPLLLNSGIDFEVHIISWQCVQGADFRFMLGLCGSRCWLPWSV